MSETFDIRLLRLGLVTDRMRQQVFDAGSTARVHEEDILEAARLVDSLLGKSRAPKV